jgi:hypothetical protein
MLREQEKKLGATWLSPVAAKSSLLNQANAPRQQYKGSRGN